MLPFRTLSNMQSKIWILIFVIAAVLVSPHLITQNMILGSDAIFHFNRFYDTSEQIRHGNFQYFISMYGFQQSGRMVNALYSPFFDYFHGFLVLISHNWFMYQVISNFILFCIAGISMYAFLRAGKLSYNKCFLGAILYMSTFSILYWVTRQGFSSWGAAILPLCLTVIFPVLEEKTIPKYRLGLLTALIFQVHLLSAFLLILIYIPIFGYAFYKTQNKIIFIGNLFREMIIFIILTLNILATILTVQTANDLIAPFVNRNMSRSSINENGYYWLFNPLVLILILAFVVYRQVKNWQRSSTTNRLLFKIMIGFLTLSTSLVPWNILIRHGNPLAELIQFPFRFFVPVSILVIYLFLNNVERLWPAKVFAGIGVLQIITLIWVTLEQWEQPQNYARTGSTTIMQSHNADQVRNAFYAHDKQQGLKLITKPTPDYLPNMEQIKRGGYGLYARKVINKQDQFAKYIKDNQLIVKADKHKTGKQIEFPIIVYAHSQLTTNGQPIPTNMYRLSKIGTPIIDGSALHQQQIEVHWQPNHLTPFIGATLVAWPLILGLISFSGYRTRKVTAY